MESVHQIETAFLKEFSSKRQHYKKIANYIHDFIRDYCDSSAIQSTEWRAKTIESFQEKCSKINDDGSTKYDKPFDQLTDLAGVRIIVYTRDQVDLLCNEIKENFDVQEEIDVGERVYKDGRFGYQSKHLVVKLAETKDKMKLKETAHIRDLFCEIQVRTLLQHAWAAIEHKIQYKRKSDIPLEVRKRFSALAGALELADRELQSIVKDGDALRSIVQDDLEMSLTIETLQQSTPSENIENIYTESENDYQNVRELINNMKYKEAEEIYTRKISLEPKSITLKIGRAKVRFLAGDTTGAIKDLDEFDAIKSDDYASKKLRYMIVNGLKEDINISDTVSEYANKVSEATGFLEKGQAAEAFASYVDLEQNGYNKAFAYFGMAMACSMQQDISGSMRFLNKLRIIPSTPMAVNIIALSAVNIHIQYGSTPTTLIKLKDSIANFPNYSIENSPIRYFIKGCIALNLKEKVSDICEILNYRC